MSGCLIRRLIRLEGCGSGNSGVNDGFGEVFRIFDHRLPCHEMNEMKYHKFLKIDSINTYI